MPVSVSTTLRSKGADFGAHLARIRAALAEKDQGVKIGLPAGKAPRDLVQIGVWNHFGTGGGGWGGPIPPRPFITVTFFEQRVNIRRDLKQIMRRTLMKPGPLKDDMAKMGIKYSGAVQARIASGPFAPNAAATIRLKGSARPLIDTGRMRQSITWKLT